MFLERIERLDPKLNAFRVVWGDDALAAAADADERLSSGAGGDESPPLLGVPIAIKDTVDVEGDVTMLGTAGFDQPAERDSEIVARLRAAGAVFLGKTNLPELAIHGFTESETFGVTRNPWNTERTPGGSSGGSGAAVAAGMAALAHASDGAGSIRYPAANCGLFGLKPQRNRVRSTPSTGTGSRSTAASAGRSPTPPCSWTRSPRVRPTRRTRRRRPSAASARRRPRLRGF